MSLRITRLELLMFLSNTEARVTPLTHHTEKKKKRHCARRRHDNRVICKHVPRMIEVCFTHICVIRTRLPTVSCMMYLLALLPPVNSARERRNISRCSWYVSSVECASHDALVRRGEADTRGVDVSAPRILLCHSAAACQSGRQYSTAA